ncbi:MAG: PAS domain S-box protein [Chlorobi bacterium]|nr:PAS domain S-box protein [Chlorobiota bacterium]
MVNKTDTTTTTGNNKKDSLYELLFLENTNPIFIGNETGRVIAVNQAAVELTQYSEEEILDMEKIDFLFPHNVLKEKPMQYEDLFENKTIVNERKLRKKNGDLVWISMKSKQLSSGNLVATMTEIGDKKKFEELVGENEAVLQTIIDSTPQDLICLKDGKGRWLKANKTTEELFGINNSDYLGRTSAELAEKISFFKETLLDCMETDELAWESGELFRRDIEIILPDEDVKVYDVIKVPSFNEDGSRKNMTVFGRDVTEEREQQKEIKEKEETYRLVVNNAHEAILILRDGIIEYVNQAVEKITGFTADECIYNAFIDFVHPVDRDKLVDYHFRRFEGDKDLPDRYEFRVISKSGKTVWLENKPTIIMWKGVPAGMAFLRDITEEKRITEELKASENKFRSIIQTIEDGVFTSDIDGTILFASSNFLEDKGYSVDEVVGKNILNFIYEEDRAFAFGKWQEIKEDKSFQVEFRLLKKNGEPFWVRTRSSVVFKNDEIVNIISIIIDIQERKNIENKLQKSEVKFRRVIENAPVGIAILHDAKMAFLNPQLVSMLKYSDFNELLDSDLMEYVDRESKSKLADYIKSLERPQKIKTSAEIILKARDGEKIECMILGQKTEFRNEKSVQLYFYDLSEKKKSEKKVLQLTRAVEQASTMVYITDKNGLLEYANNSFLRETGYQNDEIIGEKADILRSGKNDRKIFLDLWDTILDGKDWYGELLNKRKDGSLYWVSLTISPIKDNENNLTHFVAISENISKQKEIEENLKISKEKAEQSKKLKSDFIAQVSHELRTPVNTMLSFLSLLREQLEDPDHNHDASLQFISFIESGGKRLVRTVDLFINMLEIQNNMFEPHYQEVDLANNTLAEVLAEFTHEAYRKGLKINSNILSDEVIVLADPYCLSQIFKQIVDNSIKYTEKGEVNINIFKNDQNKIVTEISDTGVGIKEEFLPEIFELFSQEESGYSRKFEGNGLGLTLTKHFCDMNNIDIKIQSEKNVGTVITLTF